MDNQKMQTDLTLIKGYVETAYVQSSRTSDTLDELYYADIFNSTIVGSSWWKYGISPGNMAVGYSFLYALYRILDDIKPTNILELGLGQSSLMTTAYAQDKKGSVKHTIIEHDHSWIDFFKHKLHGDNYSIFTPDLLVADVEGHNVNVYDDISPVMKGEKYDLMIIDAPFGSEFISRIDTLDYIPECLSDDFILMLHDASRPGEQNTIKMIENILNEGNVKFSKGYYRGRAYTYVATSESRRFITTL